MELRTLRLDGLAFGGDAVGRDEEGRVVFVAGGAPGDLVEVKISEAKKTWARAEVVRVLEAGERADPPCPYQSECGGCPWMHVEVGAQLEAKQEIVERALAKSNVHVEDILPAPQFLGYRRRAKMTARGPAIGFQARRSHRVVDVDRCVALDPRLDAAMQKARESLRGLLGDDGTVSGLVAQDGKIHLTIDTDAAPAPETLADHAAALLGLEKIVGVGVRAGGTKRFYGEARLELEPELLASAAGFAQANASQNQHLRRLVLRWAFPDEASELPRVLELYAGDGNFTRDLVRRARVVAVEGEPDGAARLIDNLRTAAPRVRQHAHTTPSVDRWVVRPEPSEQAARKLAQAGEKFDVVVLDPPRAGASECLEYLAALEPTRIVYVSCDPMTLARDVNRLETMGYRGIRAQPVDMMPHTSHVEVVCLLERVT
jgi:23S rRNA (uracil1939-C5)-methyltransferase